MIGREVRRHREALGLTGTQLAARARMAPSAVSQIETGKRTPSSASVVKLAEALGVEVGALYPKGQSPLPFEAEGDPAEGLRGRCGHAHLALLTSEEIAGHLRGPDAEGFFGELIEEYRAISSWPGGAPEALLYRDPNGKFMKAWAVQKSRMEEEGIPKEEIGRRTVEALDKTAAAGAV